MKRVFMLALLVEYFGLASVHAEVIINVKKIINSKYTRAERWIDLDTNIICYSALPSGSDIFRKQCLLSDRKPKIDGKIEVTAILTTQYKQAEKWLDEDNKIVCYSALPGGLSTSFDLVCNRLP